MKRIEYRNVYDKSKWPRGPWDDEPDKVQWQDEATGLPCMIRRSPIMGSWCGYVGVSPDHPAFGQDYNAIDDERISVHGGLAYAGGCTDGVSPEISICHVVEPGEPDHVWWLGFDCGHAFDHSPALSYVLPDAIYRDQSYIENEVRQLASQLAEIENK
jgi:hypothetical protein